MHLCLAQEFFRLVHPFSRHIFHKSHLHGLGKDRTEVVGADIDFSRHGIQGKGFLRIIFFYIGERFLQNAFALVIRLPVPKLHGSLGQTA